MSTDRGSDKTHRGDLFALIPAAGSGTRMNSDTPKQYLKLNNITVLERSINRVLALDEVLKLVVVLDAESISDIDTLLFADGLRDSRIEFCVGGASRCESVKNGLDYLQQYASSNSQILVHDAARPCVRVADINKLLNMVNDSNGGLLAMPVNDTIKRANANKQVQETVDRSQLWRAATPQLFNLQELLRAINKTLQNNIEITDEASAMQFAGYTPQLVECQADNIKITTATDLVLAEHYLSAQANDPA